jgi:hypothetical protein
VAFTVTGRAYALEVTKLGARLALNDSDRTGLAETVKLLRKVIDRSDYPTLPSVMLNLSTSAQERNAE